MWLHIYLHVFLGKWCTIRNCFNGRCTEDYPGGPMRCVCFKSDYWGERDAWRGLECDIPGRCSRHITSVKCNVESMSKKMDFFFRYFLYEQSF